MEKGAERERGLWCTLGFFPSSISDSFEIWNVLGNFPLELLEDERQDELTWRQEKSLMHNESVISWRRAFYWLSWIGAVEGNHLLGLAIIAVYVLLSLTPVKNLLPRHDAPIPPAFAPEPPGLCDLAPIIPSSRKEEPRSTNSSSIHPSRYTATRHSSTGN